jgi:pheromone shutdown protein TraB
MITIIGVGHVFQISEQVREIIIGETPAVVCVELDPRRYRSLVQKEGVKNPSLAYRMIALFQRRLARQYGGEAGQEMISAVRSAGEIGAAVLFVDVDAGVMFGRLWKEMAFSEKVRLMFSALYGLFLSRDRLEKELDQFQEHEEAYMTGFAQQFPTLKKVLIDDRNTIMADRIRKAEETYGSVVAVVGDGHVEGIRRLLGGAVRVIRLRELRSMSKTQGSGAAEASFSFNTSVED